MSFNFLPFKFMHIGRLITLGAFLLSIVFTSVLSDSPISKAQEGGMEMSLSSSSSSEPIADPCGCDQQGVCDVDPEMNDPYLDPGTEALYPVDDVEHPEDFFHYQTGFTEDPNDQFVMSTGFPRPFPIPPHVLAPYFGPGPAAFTTMRENLRPQATFAVTTDETPIPFLRIRNRGIMVSRRQYPNGACLSFQYRWVMGTPQGNYPDVLRVAFRTNGQQRNQSSWEINDGIAVHIARNAVHVERFAGGQSVEILGSTLGLTFSQGTFYPITITERNDTLEVRWGLGANDVLTVNNLPQRGNDNYIGIYNREPAAGNEQEAHLARNGLGGAPFIRALAAQ